MKYDPAQVYEDVREKGSVVLDFDSNTEADALVDGLYGITEQVSCSGKIQPDGTYKLTVTYSRIHD